MRFQSRDGEILKLIYENDGVVAKRHIKSLFWRDSSQRAMEQRLSKLYHEKYFQFQSQFAGWVGRVHYLSLAEISQPKGNNENQLRNLQKKLQSQGVRWVREPRWSFLRHDLATIDFRLMLQYALSQLKSLNLERWLPESEFRIDMDIVDISFKRKEGKSIRMKRGVCPDGYFEIVDSDRLREGQPAKARFLLEIDMGTHDNPSFGKFKALPGAAYIKSASYRDRFGSNHGTWLVVTGGGEKRMMNLLNQTKEKIGKDAGLFYFTTFNLLNSGNLLTNPIWWRADQLSPVSILSV
jgi:hypothetical protein